MNRRLTLFLLILCVIVVLNVRAFAVHIVLAQDEGLNLPTELYVLENDGVVTRYGLGTAGISDVTPADAVVLDFAVAPDGNHIAYRTEQGLTLKEIFSDNQTAIEAESASLPPIRGQGDTLAWTEDGTALAYTTLYGARVYFPATGLFSDIPQSNVVSVIWSPDNSYLVVEAQNLDPNAHSSFWWIYRRDNTTFTLVSAIPSSVGVSWLDNARLVFAPETGGLYAMDMSAGNVQTELLDTSVIYRLPYVRDDGTITAFANVSADEATAVPNSSGVIGRLIALLNGAAVETGGTPLDVDHVRWAPRGDLLVAFRGGALALVNPASGFAFSLPLTSAVAYGWGPLPPPSVASLTLPSDGYFLSDFSTGIAQIWRLPADGSPADPFTLADDPITEYAISPDGQQVVYVSGGKLWLQAVDPQATASELATIEGTEAVSPAFNQTGQQVAFVTGGGISLVDLPDGTAQQIVTGYSNPRFAPNINALLVNGDTGLGLLDIAAGTVQPAGSSERGFFLSDGNVLTFDDSHIILWDTTTTYGPDITQFPLPESLSIESVAYTVSDGEVRLIFEDTSQLLARPQVSTLSLQDGSVVSENIGYIVAPQLSHDGSFVAGYRYLRTDANNITRGSLLFVDVDSGTASTLSLPPEAWGFQWGP